MGRKSNAAALPKLYNALIRTHHIRSRKKVAVLKDAAIKHECAVLLKSDGKAPGVMYVEGKTEEQVKHWVEAVRALHYLNYELVAPPAMSQERTATSDVNAGIDEVTDLKEFAKVMEQNGTLAWWREAMGFTHSH